MSKSPRWAIALSAVFHFALVLVFGLRRSPPPPEKITVQLEIKDTPKGSPQAHAGHKGHGKPKVSWENLKLSTVQSYGSRGNFKDEGELGLSEEEWGSHGNRFGEVEHFTKFSRLFTEIEGLLQYPHRLGMHGLSDTVNSRLVFDENSNCDWNKTKVGGSQPYFRVYTLALLKKLCALENVQHMHFAKGSFVDLSFAFLVVGKVEESEQKPPDTIQGNVLLFQRTYFRSPLEYHIGPFQGFLLTPAIGLDFPWIFEHWETWVQGKDPLREFKESDS
jgi:hypothetical protein